MFKKLKFTILATLAGILAAQGAFAFVAPNPIGPISLQHGFPVWVEDDANVRADLSGLIAAPPVPGNDFSQLAGFGPEAFWWSVSGDNGLVNIEFAMEAAYLTETPANGDQAPFARIRVGGKPVAGAPVSALGTWNVAVSNPAVNFDIVATDDGKGGIEFKNQGTDPSFGAATNIPPFSAGLAGSPQTLFYLLGGTAAPTVTITRAGEATQTIAVGNFLPGVGVLVPNPIINQPPVAAPDISAAVAGSSKVLRVLDNDTDQPGDIFLINPQAIGLVYPLGAIPTNAATPFEIGVAPVATTNGGTVKKNTDGTLTYTAPAATFGVDTFEYVVQDDAGCISGTDCFVATVPVPTLVSVAVQQITVTKAEFRPKFMKWHIEGKVDGIDPLNQTVTIYAGDDVINHPVIAVNVPTDANGNFTFTGKSQATPGDLAQIIVETPELITKVMAVTNR